VFAADAVGVPSNPDARLTVASTAINAVLMKYPVTEVAPQAAIVS
jgi:hypothetical protein